ncbi:putative magnesium transporter NIPA7 [Corynascus novoguineensis]|uniref:Magnesium transporter NIPA7 n=1 Tax=Corynascus novoguineensis TaxID=1126955 RepID=A0AAN7HT90_9PEZI|nr:putative magnesium transporter NIPA7 [Corynascus novoguineensis]
MRHSLPPAGLAYRTLPLSIWLSSDSDGNPEDELQNWSSLIGIVTAICGNVLIALALNLQRYAHTRLHRKRAQVPERVRQAMRHAGAAGSQGDRGSGQYGAAVSSNRSSGANFDGTLGRYGAGSRYSADEDARDSSETEPLAQSFHSDGTTDDDADDDSDAKPKVTSSYLRDPYWWLGQVLITVGEMGNFLAYGFAPASIVSPLGVVALVSNCVIAPIFFKEKFRQRDFWGVIIAITGAVTVVLSAETEETKLGPHEVWGAITTMAFEIYLGVSCALIVLLMWLSPRYGHKTILIDLGLVGLFGGYTVLSTKGVSSMLSATLFRAFTTPVTYVLAFILLSTAIMQVRYVNKALQRFDSTQVIPVQFVLFTLSVIIGSAILYRDFERTTSEQAIKFVGGCLFTFFGVFLITSGRPRQDDDDEPTLSDAEGIEETIGLAEQDRASPPTPPQPRRRRAASRSAGSSRTSRVSFSDVDEQIPGQRTSRSIPSLRKHFADSRYHDHHEDEDEDDDDDDEHLLLSNPWQDPATPPTRPSPGIHTISSDSLVSAIRVPTTTSATTSTPNATHQDNDPAEQPTPKSKTIPSSAVSSNATPSRTSLQQARDKDRDTRPATPRAPHAAASASSVSSRLPPPSHQVYSPSPFSSTVSAVVGDTLLLLRGNQGQTQGQNQGQSQQELGRCPPDGSVGGDGSLPPPGHDDGHWGGNRTESQSSNSTGYGKGGLRGRARSLSHTLRLAGLFGGGGGNGEGNSGNVGGSWVGRRATLPRRDTARSTPDGGAGGSLFGGPL